MNNKALINAILILAILVELAGIIHVINSPLKPSEQPRKSTPTPAISPAQYHGPRSDCGYPGCERPRPLTLAEQRDSVTPGKRIANGYEEQEEGGDFEIY